jgi:hypothetical protein
MNASTLLMFTRVTPGPTTPTHKQPICDGVTCLCPKDAESVTNCSPSVRVAVAPS